MSTEIKVGLLFMIGIGVLIWFTLSVTRIGSGHGNYALKFAHVGGLKEGDPVTYNGVRIGSVTGVAPIIDEGVPRVRVVFSIIDVMRPNVLISERSRARIEKEMLGQASVMISSNGGAPVTAETLLLIRGESSVGLSEALGSIQQLVDENRAEVNRALKSISTGMEEFGKMSAQVKELVAENRPDIRSAIVNVSGAAGQIRDTLAENRKDISAAIVGIKDAATKAYAILNDNQTNLRKTLDGAPAMVTSIEQAAGQIRDTVSENRRDLKATMGNVAAFSGRLDTIGANLDKIIAQIASGKGTLGRLTFEDTVHDKATTALDSFQARLEEIKPVTRGFSDLRLIGGIEGGMNADSGVTNGGVYLRIEPKPWKFYQLGVSYRGAPTDRDVTREDPDKLGIDFNLVLGWRFFPDDERQRYGLSVAAGLIDSKPGAWVSTPLWNDRLSMTVLARQGHTNRDPDERRYEDSSVVVRSWVAWRLWDRVELRAGVDDLGNHPGPFIGISAELLDNDLRNLLIGSSLVR